MARYLAERNRCWNARKERDGQRQADVITAGIGKWVTYNDVIA
ncbi:hypothetical protein [Sandarakinorhabdus sp. DWP1-3-1]